MHLYIKFQIYNFIILKRAAKFYMSQVPGLVSRHHSGFHIVQIKKKLLFLKLFPTGLFLVANYNVKANGIFKTQTFKILTKKLKLKKMATCPKPGKYVVTENTMVRIQGP